MNQSVAEVAAETNLKRDSARNEYEFLTQKSYDINSDRQNETNQRLADQTRMAIATPEMALINMLRYGLLALQLLPGNSCAGIIILTDSMLSAPNASVLNLLLTQLRMQTITCSFLQVGSSAHPHSCLGFLPYTDLMNFIATATFGAYLPLCPDIVRT